MFLKSSFLLCLCMCMLVYGGLESYSGYIFDNNANGWLKLHTLPTKWSEAKLHCDSEHSAVLASPLTSELQNAIKQFLLREQGYQSSLTLYTGIHANYADGDFSSVEGYHLSNLPITLQQGQSFDYKDSESCVIWESRYDVYTKTGCDIKLPYVCYKSLPSTSQNLNPQVPVPTSLQPKTSQRPIKRIKLVRCVADGDHLIVTKSELQSSIIDYLANNPSQNVTIIFADNIQAYRVTSGPTQRVQPRLNKTVSTPAITNPSQFLQSPQSSSGDTTDTGVRTPNQNYDTQNAGSSVPNPGYGSPTPGSRVTNSGNGYPNTGNNIANSGNAYPNSRSNVGNSGNGYPNSRSNEANSGNAYPNAASNIASSGNVYPNTGSNVANPGNAYPNSGISLGNSGNGYPNSRSNEANSGNAYPNAASNIANPGNVYTNSGSSLSNPGYASQIPGNKVSNSGNGATNSWPVRQGVTDYTLVSSAGGWFKLHGPATWSDAKAQCAYEGGVLVSPLTNELRDGLKQYVMSVNPSVSTIFTGVRASLEKNDYVSVEDVLLKKMPVILNTDVSNDYRSSESCISMSTHSSVSDRLVDPTQCSRQLHFVCFKKENAVMACGTRDQKYIFEKRIGKCYKFHNKGETWSNAYSKCKDEGADLAVINSQLESVVLREIFANNPKPTAYYRYMIYLGARDWKDGKSWMTVEGQKLQDSGYLNWASTEPNNARKDENCLSFHRSGQLYDDPCDLKLAFICEKRSETLVGDPPSSQWTS